jgi:hypothetical protein
MALTALSIVVPGVVAPPVGVTPRKHFKDASATIYTVGMLDASDEQSYPQKADPAVNELWYDISPADGADAVITGSTRPSWNNGFLFPQGNAGLITLPAQFKPAADSLGHAEMFWMLIPETTGLRRGVGWFGTGAGSSQAYGFYFNNVNRQLVCYYDGGNATITLAAAQFPITIGATKFGLHLFCFGRVSDGAGGFLRRMRIYNAATGLFSSSTAASGATSAQSTSNAAFGVLGSLSVDSNVMRAYRARIDDVKLVAGVATSSWFDALCDIEFNANKARGGVDWNVA